MKFNELVQAYFERSNALYWYWTIYVIVIGGILAFSLFREEKNFARTILITILFACFAYKNLGGIGATTAEREAILGAMDTYPAGGTDEADVGRIWSRLKPTLEPAKYEGFAGIRNFHVGCDLLTIVALWVREWRRKKQQQPPETGAT
jgi:hypothetical protein